MAAPAVALYQKRGGANLRQFWTALTKPAPFKFLLERKHCRVDKRPSTERPAKDRKRPAAGR